MMDMNLRLNEDDNEQNYDESMPLLMPETSIIPDEEGQIHSSEKLSNQLNYLYDAAIESDAHKTEESVDTSSWVPMKNKPFNMRLANLNNFPAAQTAYRVNYRSHSMACVRAKIGCIQNAAKSLDLVRTIVQKSINREINQVIQRYVQRYIQPALANIRLNCRDQTVGEEHINTVCRQILEECKKVYTAEHSRSATPDLSDNVSDAGSTSDNRTTRSSNAFGYLKHRLSSGSENGSVAQRFKKKKRPHLHGGGGSSGRSTPNSKSGGGKNDAVRRDGPRWDEVRLKPETLFVMGAKANKALGLGATRGRLYIKHPDVFKYSGDQDDKQWLHEHRHMPATGGKIYLLVVDDIKDLAATDEYRNNPGLQLHELIGFHVPDWMIEKMKVQMCAMRTGFTKTLSKLYTSEVGAMALAIAEASANTNSFEPDYETVEETVVASPLNATGGFEHVTNPMLSIDLHDDAVTSELDGLDTFENEEELLPSAGDLFYAGHLE